MRVARLALIVLLAGAATALQGLGAADHPARVPCLVAELPRELGCPDLVVDGSRFNAHTQTRSFSATSCAVEEGYATPGVRRLLRFTLTTPNVGAADLVVGEPSTQPDLFEFGACHGHWHFRDYADYRLWTPEQFDAWHALRVAQPELQAHEVLAAHPELAPVLGAKRGSCVVDLVPYGGLVPKFQSCAFQGISAGWADEYFHLLDGQWIDITGLPGGAYVLEVEVNAERVYEEARYDNGRAWRSVSI